MDVVYIYIELNGHICAEKSSMVKDIRRRAAISEISKIYVMCIDFTYILFIYNVPLRTAAGIYTYTGYIILTPMVLTYC